MKYENQIASHKPEVYYSSLFEAMPGSCILLNNDAPIYTILASTPEYLSQTGTTKEGIVGKGIFEAFPGNPDDPTDTGTSDLRASLEHVLLHKEPHYLPIQRYDVAGEAGSFSERYWEASNKPVFSSSGEVSYIIHSAEDITADVKAAAMEKQMKGLEESEQDLRSLVLQAPIGICVIDAKTLVSKIVNESFIEISGKRIEEIEGVMYWDTFSEARPYYEDALNKVIQQGVTFRANEVEVPLTRHGKLEILNVTFVYEPVKNLRGEVKKVVVWVIDNTPQVVARKKLEESEERFRSMADASPVMIWTLDQTGNSTYYNRRAREFTGHTEKDLHEGRSWQVAIHPDDIAMAGSVVSNAVSNRIPYQMECRMMRVDGQWRWLLNQGTPRFGSNGEYFGFVGSSIDITERKNTEQALEESESRFRSLADQSPMFIFIIDPAPLAPVNYWNKTWLEYTGQSFEEAQGRSWDGIIHPDDVPLVMKIYGPAFQSQQPYFIPAVRTKRYDGIYRWHAFKGNPRYSADGSFNGYVGVGFDVHEQKITEERLEALVIERTKELQRSNEDLQQFAHVASHDLKEPVRKVKTFISRLEHHLDGRLDEAASRFIERIHSAANRMYTMIDGVLTYSTINNITQTPQLVDLNEVVKSIETDLEVIIQKSGAQFNYHQLPLIEGAPILMYQLFYNLINNSIKFTKPNVQPQIRITSEIVMENDRQFARIILSDNGIGFEYEQADLIFDAFTRLNSKDKFEGTGLGLALCKKIVERHGGSISASGVPDEGAAFTIVLPVQQNGQSV
ncbi:MAG: PAS domain S-box protein [Chitinophagaceae bacterium]